MFTGIIEEVGEIVAIEQYNGDMKLRVDTNELDISKIQLGESIATKGVCLTVARLCQEGFEADGD